MHYRRMDPQPHPQSRLQRFMESGRIRYDVRQPGIGMVVDIPEDMPTAKPWRASDGEWYWRTAPLEGQKALNGVCEQFTPSAVLPYWCGYCGWGRKAHLV